MALMIPMTGTYNHTLDAKNRLFLPAKHREALTFPVVVFPSIRDKSLKIYTLEDWMKYNEKIEAMDRRDSDEIIRFYSENADTVSADSQGRILLGQNLVDHAELSGHAAVVIGCNRYLEIWSDDNYRAMKQAQDVASIRAKLERMGL